MSKGKQMSELDITRIKSEKTAIIISRYNRTVARLREWDMEHDEASNLSEKLRYKLNQCLLSAKGVISEWKRDTPMSVIDKEWKNAVATHDKWIDITAAYFNIIEGKYDDYDLKVEDLFNMRILPHPYLRKDLNTGESIPLRPEDKIVELVTRCSTYVTDFYKKKNERDKIIKEYQAKENNRHKGMTAVIESWNNLHPEYSEVGKWMTCIEMHTHARVYHIVSLLSTKQSFRDEEITEAEWIANNGDSRIHSLIAEFAGYVFEIEEEDRKKKKEEQRIREEEERKAEAERKKQQEEEERLEALRKKEEEERRKKEEAEMIKQWEAAERERKEKIADQQKEEVAAMLPDLEAKFNTPKNNRKLESSTIRSIEDSNNNNKKEKKMTKVKETKQVIKPVEIETIDINLSEFGFENEQIDTTKDYNVYLDGDKIWLSDALGSKLYEKNVFTVCFKENKGVAFLVFGSDFSEFMNQDDKERYFVESKSVAASVRKTLGCNDAFQTHTYKLGYNNGMIFVGINK